MAIIIKNETYLRAPEAAARIGRVTTTVYQKWKSWGWHPYHYGPNLLFKQSQIDQWLESQIINDFAE